MKNAAELKSAGTRDLAAAQRRRARPARPCAPRRRPPARAARPCSRACARCGRGSAPASAPSSCRSARERGQQQRRLHLRARHRQLVVDAAQLRAAADRDGRPPAVGGRDLRAHLPQRRGDALHRPLPQRRVARERAVERLAREQPHQAAESRCPSCRGRASCCGARRPCGPTPSMRTSAVARRRSIATPMRLERRLRREAVLAREKAADDRRALRQSRRASARGARSTCRRARVMSPADAIRRRRAKVIRMLRHGARSRGWPSGTSPAL